MKTILLSIVAFMAIGLTSCQKDYYCDCRKIYTGNSGSTSLNDDTYTYNDTRARAERKCQDQETSGSDLGGSYSRECSIR